MSQKLQLPYFTSTATPAELNNHFGLVQQYINRTAAGCVVEVTASATADAPFRIDHNLGIRPSFAQALGSSAGSLYATDDDVREWNAAYIKARFPVAKARLLVKVEA